MKVLDLRCANGHGFEGWFASEDDYMQQNGGGLLQCPMCNDAVITRMPSAPRLNLSGAREPKQALPAAAAAAAAAPSSASTSASASASASAPAQARAATAEAPQPADLQAAWMTAVRQLMNRTEDVGDRFAEEARRIHYGETEERGIRGQATNEERAALREEGIETVAIPVPAALKGPLQ